LPRVETPAGKKKARRCGFCVARVVFVSERTNKRHHHHHHHPVSAHHGHGQGELFIMPMGKVNWQVPTDIEFSDAVNLYMPAFCCGFVWIAVGHEVAFGGVQNVHVTRGILNDARRYQNSLSRTGIKTLSRALVSELSRAHWYQNSLSRLNAIGVCVHYFQNSLSRTISKTLSRALFPKFSLAHWYSKRDRRMRSLFPRK